jgi:hypothetical protein
VPSVLIIMPHGQEYKIACKVISPLLLLLLDSGGPCRPGSAPVEQWRLQHSAAMHQPAAAAGPVKLGQRATRQRKQVCMAATPQLNRHHCSSRLHDDMPLISVSRLPTPGCRNVLLWYDTEGDAAEVAGSTIAAQFQRLVTILLYSTALSRAVLTQHRCAEPRRNSWRSPVQGTHFMPCTIAPGPIRSLFMLCIASTYVAAAKAAVCSLAAMPRCRLIYNVSKTW